MQSSKRHVFSEVHLMKCSLVQCSKVGAVQESAFSKLETRKVKFRKVQFRKCMPMQSRKGQSTRVHFSKCSPVKCSLCSQVHYIYIAASIRYIKLPALSQSKYFVGTLALPTLQPLQNEVITEIYMLILPILDHSFGQITQS